MFGRYRSMRYFVTVFMSSIACIDALTRRVRGNLAEGDLSRALDNIRAFVDGVINDPTTVGRVFAGPELDCLCAEIGRIAAGPSSSGAAGNSVRGRKGTIILASEIAAAGGHIEVMKDIVSLGLTEAPYTVVITDCFNRADQAIVDRFARATPAEIRLVESSSSAERLHATIVELRRRPPQTLVVMTHNQDSVGIAAASAGLADRVLYMHHGDHHLSLGVTSEGFVHVDLSNSGFNQCREIHGHHDNRYWPLTAHDVGRVPRVKFMAYGSIITATSGRPEKFVSSGEPDYFALLPRLMALSRGQHFHIGALDGGQLDKIIAGIAANGIDPARFVHLPWVPSVARTLLEQEVDLYLSSFPITGSKAVIEAMSAGIPLLLHQSHRSRFLSSVDLGYPEAFVWRKTDDLLAIVESLTPAEIERHSRLSRAQFERHHHQSVLIAAAHAEGPQRVDIVPPLRANWHDALAVYLEDRATQSLDRDWLAERVSSLNDERRKLVAANKTYRKDIASLQNTYDSIFVEHQHILAAYEGHARTIERVWGLDGELVRLKREIDTLRIELSRLAAARAATR